MVVIRRRNVKRLEKQQRNDGENGLQVIFTDNREISIYQCSTYKREKRATLLKIINWFQECVKLKIANEHRNFILQK